MTKKPTTSEFEKSLAHLAQSIADQALTEDDFKAKVDAFKALTTFHIGLVKVKARVEDDEDRETFNDLIKGIKAGSGSRPGH